MLDWLGCAVRANDHNVHPIVMALDDCNSVFDASSRDSKVASSTPSAELTFNVQFDISVRGDLHP
jgi:hypothetical protein